MVTAIFRMVCAALVAFTVSAASPVRHALPKRQAHTARATRTARNAFIPDRYVVVLDDPSVSARFPLPGDAGSSAAAAYRRQVEARQDAVAGELASRQMYVTSRVSHYLNALFVWAPGHGIDELRAIPGVKLVTPMRRLRATLNRAVQLMNAQAAWTTLGGQSNAGKGVKIAMFDSGIDFTNPAFADSSLTAPAGYPICSGFPGATGSGNICGSYTNSKVIVARSYIQALGAGTGSNPAANSSPDDPFPHDRFGHGTATAMIAAGNTITAPAPSTTGSTITMTGMAPKAYLGIYKVAGTFDYASDESEMLALEDAAKDGMDVISLSYGGLALSDWASDPLASAFEQAATTARPAGSLPSMATIPVIVVAAGNDGSDGADYGYNFYPSFNTINSPSNAPDVISVGATTNSHIMEPTVSVVATGAPSNLKNIVALAGDSYFFPSYSGANSSPLVDVSKVGDATACTALPSGSLTNSFALILYSTCGFDTPALNAQNAGAVGFIYILPAGTAVAPFDFSSAPSGINETGPSAAISASDGQNLKNYIDANAGAEVTIDLGGQEEDVSALSSFWVSIGGSTLTQNLVAGYSSFGPTPDGQIKPDIVATGGWDPSFSYLYGGFYLPTQSFDAYDSFMYSANGFMAADGTSFATPLVAGAAALAIQAHPGLTGTKVRSLVVNSSAQTVTTDDDAIPVDAEWIGAGMLDAGAAVAATVTAEPATISFGVLKSSSLPAQKTVTVTNVGSSSVTLKPIVSCCTVNGNAGTLGATVSASLSSSTVASGATSTLTVNLNGSLPAAGEYSGSIALQGSSLHIPFMMMVSDGTPAYIEPNFQPGYVILEGPPGMDMGVKPYIQVTDQFGAPVANANVIFTVTPSGSVTMQSATNHPACQSAPSSSTVTCPTDQFGWAWMDAMLGSTVSQPQISFSVAGFSDSFYANIQAAPTVTPGGVADAASYLTTLVPGSYAAIFGSNFTTSNYPNAQSLFAEACPTGPCVYPISFDYISVSFDVSGATYPGFPYYVGSGQVNLIVPWELEGQTSAQVKVTWGGDLYSNVVTVPIANYNPSFIQSCGNQACALDTNYKVISPSNPATRGQYIQLYANGLGPVTNPPGDGVAATASPLSKTTTTPVVTIGGAVVPSGDVGFSGLAPFFPSLYQINVKVPQSAQTGSAVPITLQIGGVTSPAKTVIGSVTIAVQ